MLLVGHGTRNPRGEAQFRSLVERVRRGARGAYEVAGGFMELSDPSVAEAVGQLCRDRTRHLVAVPLMLLAAGHGKGHIPGTLMREADHRPGLTFSYGRRLGPHPTLLSVLERRIDAALTERLSGAPRAGTTVILAGQGSTDPDGNAELAKVARLLWEGRGYDCVEAAYLSMTSPGLPAVLDRVFTLGARRIVVAQHLLFSGVLSARVRTMTEDWATRHPQTTVVIADLVGDCDELAGLVIERYEEALRGDIRMNCDTCVYRTPFPTLEHRVGEPQRPHDHHDHHDHVEECGGLGLL